MQGLQEPALASYEQQAQPSQTGLQPSSDFATPFKVNFRLPEREIPGGCLDQDSLRQATLQSVESTLSTFDFPNTPSKLYTEPARLQEPSPFNLSSLDFLDDSPPGEPSPLHHSTWLGMWRPLSTAFQETKQSSFLIEKL